MQTADGFVEAAGADQCVGKRFVDEADVKVHMTDFFYLLDRIYVMY